MKKVVWIAAVLILASQLVNSASAEENKVIKQAKSWGAPCQTTIEKVASYIVDGKPNAAHGNYGTDNKTIYTSLAVVEETPFATTFIATGPNVEKGCSGTYFQTGVVGSSCTKFREKSLSQFEYETSFGETLIFSNNAVNMYLTPGPNSTCLVQKRELIN